MRKQIRRALSAFTFVTLLAIACPGRVGAASPETVADGSFEGPDARIASAEKAGVWFPYLHDSADARFTVVGQQGRQGSRCARYDRTAEGSGNAHLDQIIPVASNALYEVEAWLRADAPLHPVLAVMTMGWRTLATVPSGAGTNWTRVSFTFHSGDNDRVRFQWFAGAQGKLYQGFAGTSWLDDVRVTRLETPPASLQRAIALTTAPKRAEIDAASIRTATIGAPTPLRPIHSRHGVLVYDDGTEVALWGVNLQTALNWEYQARMKKCGIPLEAAALKQIADRNLDELVRMKAGLIRMHLLPSDFTDAEGNLRDSVFLDVLDYTISGCRARGIYMYLTLVNTMGHFHFKDSFMTGKDHREWLVDPALAEKTARYIRALLERTNRYTQVTYAAEPAIAVLEIANEPGYVDFIALHTEPQFAPLRRAFDRWCDARRYTGSFDLHYLEFRHDYVRAYIDRMCALIRETGSRKPIAWNLNWPRMIEGREDVFQAVAGSAVDAVSFCLYPGQDDMPQDYGQHPKDLGARNYLPFLDRNYREYERLRWVLGQRFAGKAKLVYEFETFFNQSSYLYPAMARLFRSLGVQMAGMWTYSLTPTAEYISGAHHLNLYCTPEKAVSFMMAGELFAATPRYARFDTQAGERRILGPCAVSFSDNASILQTADTYMQSRATAWTPFTMNPNARRIVACGRSPLVSYEGTGAYFVEVGDHAIDVEINPDAVFVLPHWDSSRRGPLEKVCRLDAAARHRFALNLQGWSGRVRILRLEGGKETLVPSEGDAAVFDASPGRYRIERIR